MKDIDYLILETNGVGYKVFVPKGFHSMFKEGQEVELFCALQIQRDETIELYGLPSFEALKLFELFRGVSGIGPKVSVALASLGKPEDIKKALEERNTAYFRGIKGIGEKKIQKLILELTGKIGNFERRRSGSDEVVDSLVSLGFSKTEACEVLSHVPPDIIDPQEKIKQALKLLARRP